VVAEADRKGLISRGRKDDLLAYSDLRNAIVHDRRGTAVLIADPRDDIVLAIEAICNRLAKPRLLKSLARPFPMKIFEARDLLPAALKYMRQNDFSQIVVSRDLAYVILSAEGITHWLEDKSKIDILELSASQLEEVLDFEPPDTVRYMKGSNTVDQALALFVNDIEKRVFSILVSENGRATEKPVSILTPWDAVSGSLND